MEKSNYIEKQVENILDNSNNVERLQACKIILDAVIKDIELMNDLSQEQEEYDMGARTEDSIYIIKSEDLETLVSAKETLEDIDYYNAKNEQ